MSSILAVTRNPVGGNSASSAYFSDYYQRSASSHRYSPAKTQFRLYPGMAKSGP